MDYLEDHKSAKPQLPDLELNAALLADVVPQGGLRRNLLNEANVVGDLLARVPGSIGTELADDWNNHRGELLTKTAISAGIGLGTAVLLSRSPVLAKGITGLLGLSAAIGGTAYTGRLLGKAWNADSQEQREDLVASAAKDLGRVGAELIETTPGFIGGTVGGLALTNRIAALEAISLRVREGVDFRVRTMVPERLHYIGPDARTVSGVGNGKGTIDLLRATEEIAARNPWRGVEEGRFFKVGDGKVKFSSTLSGTTDEVVMGRRAEHMFHTHCDKLLPTSGDFNSIRGTGVISVPKYGITTFFEGTSLEAEHALALRSAGRLAEAEQAVAALHGRTFTSLVVDRSRELAVKVTTKWNPASGLEPVAIKPVDFTQATQTLRTWNGKTLSLSELGASNEALLKPGMTDLLKAILQNR
ncbi:MAG: hypothetical protein K2W95_35395 [Candidatus Obscuribacterales bacterium]|nr:hypothetical protein [Candidatus Obscuribacterales bacterium]